jgi:hypothetical protein
MNLSGDDISLVRALEQHYSAYLRAVQREDGRYQQLAERLQRKPAAKEVPTATARKKPA